MGRGQTPSWIANGEKYALLGLVVKVTDPDVGKLDLSPHFQIIGGSDFTIPKEWREWLGSVRVEEVEACDLFIAAKLQSATPDVLDGENILLTNRVWGFYRGLLLSSTFATAHKPVVLTGSCRDGVVGLRQQQDLDVPVPNDFRPYADVPAAELRQAADIAAQLERMAATRQGSNRWRFHRVLHLYSETRGTPEILERKRDASRCDDRDVTSPTKQGQLQKQKNTAAVQIWRSEGQESDMVVRPRDGLMGAFGTDLKTIAPSRLSEDRWRDLLGLGGWGGNRTK
jgi:hypothetical protein